MREVNTKQHTKKRQTRKINKFELLFNSCFDDRLFDSCPVEVNRWYHSCFVRCEQIFIHSTAIFTRDQFASIKKAQPLRSVRNIRMPQRFLAMNNTSYSITSNVFFEIMWNLDAYCQLMLKSAHLRPPLGKIFDHWVDVLINTSAPSHWLNSVAWPVGPVLKFRDIPDCWRWL